MPSFPPLKTNAVAQYPASKAIAFRNQALRFLDGGEQRYRDSAGPLRRWQIRLTALDESEMAALETFFAESQGAAGSFSFTDPWDGAVYPDCSLENDGMTLQWSGELQGRTSLTIVQNRT